MTRTSNIFEQMSYLQSVPTYHRRHDMCYLGHFTDAGTAGAYTPTSVMTRATNKLMSRNILPKNLSCPEQCSTDLLYNKVKDFCSCSKPYRLFSNSS
ncbi:hypothetical protein RRG08_060863 [Elysia crispata]|uniref:Uncharacterized protein n=1 Tax=Elysia crispata TaxID=231223 RepID=A0AAE0ZGH8_9GAST|nr:hypothetical protein RRG08_060863 [Elysia crispata]